tara:strand:- start:348 stop:719 length:372 start_codon:yes stop_codon:yes gene_type:complete
MISIPNFILKRLYVKGSLIITRNGMEFQLLNKLGSGYTRRLLPLTIDGHDIPIDQCKFIVDERQVPFNAVTKENPFTLALNKVTTVSVHNVNLTKEAHNIGMGFEVAGLGVLKFDFTDIPTND